ncbi:hypothetical protein OG802_21770 [Streptomyces sp. NBC_00704]|uniref:hypothetical protein n=1 Tax=Streptomyces sp. NBC_00704 TaxID=2975809 RepID=UPI002E30FA77|nr:hypothetical protein [Streptomyces sp. NBC_00704]
MPDRSLRLLTLPPQSPQGGERGVVLLRERPASPADAPSDENKPPEDDNPFAPPPEGAPDRPWQPRRPAGGEPDEGRSPWGGQWSDRQPGRSPGGFGERPGGNPENGGPSGPGGDPGKRWDPTDPAQRHARYALLSGMWAFFFVLFGWPYVALLLGALALNWGISALRAKPRTPDPDAPPAPETSGRPQRTAAITGLVTASLALAMVAASFTAHLVYNDYYTCTNDALTNEAKQSCDDLLPKQLRDILGANA